MVRNHLARLNAPKRWPIKRKEYKYIIKTSPGPHTFKESIPLSLIISNLLRYARTTKEIKKILNEGKITVNNCVRKERSFSVGFMDVLHVSSLQENYLVIYDKKGRFALAPIKKKESSNRILRKIKRKIVAKKGKIQITCTDGTTILTDKSSYHIGDTIVQSLDKKTVNDHLPLQKGARIYVIGGKNVGTIGIVEEIKDQNIVVKATEEVFITAKRYAFVIGKYLSGEEV